MASLVYRRLYKMNKVEARKESTWECGPESRGIAIFLHLIRARWRFGPHSLQACTNLPSRGGKREQVARIGKSAYEWDPRQWQTLS